jgi:predicted RNA polymerase sigma factor
MLLTDARRAARAAPDGSIVPLAEQDRTRWETAAIAADPAPTREWRTPTASRPSARTCSSGR